MGTCCSKGKTPESQPRDEPLIQSHSQGKVENTESEPKLGRTKYKEATGQENGKSLASAAPLVLEGKLPHNCEAILREADSPIDQSSADKLYDQLYRGVFLNKKRKKYWVEKRSNANCFMLFPRDLLITWGHDERYWQWSSISLTSEESVDVAELLAVCWLEVHTRFDTSKLSPSTRYEVVYVVMLNQTADGWGVPVNLRVTLPSGTKQEREENLMTKPRSQWMEIKAGEFTTSKEENVGEMEISMYECGGHWKGGLVVKGIIIRPKI